MMIDRYDLEMELARLLDDGRYQKLLDLTAQQHDDSGAEALRLYYRAGALTRLGKIPEAIKVAEQGCERCGTAGLHNAAASAYLATDTIDGRVRTLKARDHLIEACRIVPEESRYYRDLGEIYLINREAQKAAACFAQAIRWKPRDSDYLSRFALALLRCGDREAALRFIEVALDYADESDCNTFDTCGTVALLVGDLDRAKPLFEAAVKGDPRCQYYWSHIAWLERERADRREREKQGKSYTPLYVRQKQRNRYFDESVEPPPAQVPGLDLSAPLPIDALLTLCTAESEFDVLEGSNVAFQHVEYLRSVGYERLRELGRSEHNSIVHAPSEKLYLVRSILLGVSEEDTDVSVHIEVYPSLDALPLHTDFRVNSADKIRE